MQLFISAIWTHLTTVCKECKKIWMMRSLRIKMRKKKTHNKKK